MKFLLTISIILTIGVIIISGLRELHNQKDLRILRDQVSQFQATEKMPDSPDGTTTTTDWSTIKDGSNLFSLRYPSNWTENDQTINPVVPKQLVGRSQGVFPLALTTSSNLDISPTWRQITLASGEPAYYNFEEGIDFYYVVNGANMLIWSIPVRSHDGLFTSQELTEATQIINTYQQISST